jgi:regulator of protease activity HflC (stomatin/prohibitin superfamily)
MVIINVTQVRRDILQDEALGYKSKPNELQERIASVMEARQEEENAVRARRVAVDESRRDEKQLRAIKAEASATQERLVKEEQKVKREQARNAGGDAMALVRAHMPGMSDQRFRNIPTPELRERLRANGALTVRDDRRGDGGIQHAWESP